MILSDNEAREYSKHHAITKEDISWMASLLSSQTALESCLELIDSGYKVEDIQAMVDSFNERRLNRPFPWHLLNKEDPYYQPEQETE